MADYFTDLPDIAETELHSVKRAINDLIVRIEHFERDGELGAVHWIEVANLGRRIHTFALEARRTQSR